MPQNSKCLDCGCYCRGKYDHSTLHLHVEIENLKQKLLERENHIMSMETNFLTEVDKFPNGELAALAEELLTWQDKYTRLYDAHKRIQKVNQNLEDKLLKIVDKCETEKNSLTRDVNVLKQRLAEANSNITWLKDENERNRNDVNLAIQLLQCKPSNFISQKFESLPSDLQQKVRLYMSSKKKNSEGQTKHEVKTIKVPIPTYPPTAMFYSVNKTIEDEEINDKNSGKPVDIVSAAIMAKILEEREKERQNTKHCKTCVCPYQHVNQHKSTQTDDYLDISHLFQNENNKLTFLSNNNVIKVESYHTNSSTPGGAILYERTMLPVNTTLPNTVSKKNDATILNVGRNRYQSSKVSKEVGRCLRREKSLEHSTDVIKCSEISIDGGVRFSDMSCDITGSYYKPTSADLDRSNARSCSLSIQPGNSNILLDNATCYTQSVNTLRSLNSQATVHFSRSRSTSESTLSNEDISCDSCKSFGHTETEI